MTTVHTCARCAHGVDDDARFCGWCGLPRTQPRPTPPTHGTPSVEGPTVALNQVRTSVTVEAPTTPARPSHPDPSRPGAPPHPRAGEDAEATHHLGLRPSPGPGGPWPQHTPSRPAPRPTLRAPLPSAATVPPLPPPLRGATNGPSSVGTGTGKGERPLLVWAGLLLAGLAALFELGAVAVAFPTAAANGADWSTMAVTMLPALLIAAAYAAMAVAIERRWPRSAVAASALATITVTAGLCAGSPSSPGPWTAMAGVALALLLVVERAAPGALPLALHPRGATGTASSSPRTVDTTSVLGQRARRASVLAVGTGWWAAGCLTAAVMAFVESHEVDGGTAGEVVGGVLFLVLAGVGAVVCTPMLLRDDTVPGDGSTPRWVLAGCWPVDLLAVTLADDGAHLLWPLLVLHTLLAVAAVLPLAIASTAPTDVSALRASLRAGRARVLALPRHAVLAAGGVVVILTGVVVALATISQSYPGSYPSDDTGGYGDSSGAYSGGTSSVDPLHTLGPTGSVVAVVVVALLAFAAACTPTMTPLWRSGLVFGGGFALWLAWGGGESITDGGEAFMWTVVVPMGLIATSGWGALSNRRTGATASHPGWVGPGAVPPMLALPFVAPPTAGARSRTCLEVDTALSPTDVALALGRATSVRGNWFRTYGDHVELVATEPDTVALRIGTNCTFRARWVDHGPRRTVRVGGLDRWTKSRWYYDFFIPITPAKVESFRMYKLYLRCAASEIARLDPTTRAHIRPGSHASIA